MSTERRLTEWGIWDLRDRPELHEVLRLMADCNHPDKRGRAPRPEEFRCRPGEDPDTHLRRLGIEPHPISRFFPRPDETVRQYVDRLGPAGLDIVITGVKLPASDPEQ